MIIIPLALALTLLDPPTPTPSPTPGPNNQPVAGFYVPPQAPPWAVPVLPTWGTGTPPPTLFASTPPHGTEFPAQSGTATAQIGAYTGPISEVSTPIAGLVQAGPTQTSGDINTGLDPLGTGDITLSGIGTQIEDGIGSVVGGAKVFILDIIQLGVYSPWLVPVPVALVVSTVIALFLPVIALVVRAATWLFNLIYKIAAIIGVLRWIFR
jgi:hypothetical protein